MNEINILKESKKWAVIGVTEDKEKYGYKIYKKLKDINKEVFGVSVKYNNIDGDKMYKSLTEIPCKPDIAVFVVNPKIGQNYVKECKDLGINTIWLQPGTVDTDLLTLAKSYEINPIEGCVLVVSNYIDD